ncbi:MAG TPA: hypothetical protein VKX46_01850 [Ktedonobacteraceae bacterium]|nr:hypothetical protein [Ktedonobacteraceae bacterium]
MAKRPSAFSRALQEAQQAGTEEETDRETVVVPHSETVQPPQRKAVASDNEEADNQVVKTSFYPTQDQLDKLDDLASGYNRRYRRQRKKINRNDIVRFLIDRVDLDMLDELNLKS